MTIEEKAKAYDEALKQIKECTPDENGFVTIYPEEIFPELAESKDEKIRKALIFHYQGDGCICTNEYRIDYKDIRAWLEKQDKLTEINPSEFDLRLNKLLKQFESLPKDDIASSLSFYLNVIQNDGTYKEEKQSKPADWSEANLPEFESYLCLMFQKFRTKGMCTNGEIIDYVREHAQKLKDTLCHTWSEDDERMYRGLHNLIYSTPYCDSRKELSDWLKSLKDKVQPKQEWSEEDESHIRYLIECLENCKKGVSLTMTTSTSQEYINWLKSLRPQNRWKPSCKQMGTLKEACDKHWEPNGLDPLYTLYQDLKKLM